MSVELPNFGTAGGGGAGELAGSCAKLFAVSLIFGAAIATIVGAVGEAGRLGRFGGFEPGTRSSSIEGVGSEDSVCFAIGIAGLLGAMGGLLGASGGLLWTTGGGGRLWPDGNPGGGRL